MRRRVGLTGSFAGVLAIVIGVSLAVAGCSSSSQTAGSNFVAGDGAITILAVDQRSQPISLSAQTVEGAPLDLAAYRGKTVVLNVWGSWCPPCRKEAPDLQAAYTELKGQGVQFLGINYRDDDPANALAYQKSFGVTYPSLVDDGGNLLLQLRGAVSAKSIPSTLVLDGQGRIAARVSGPTTKATLVSIVQDVQSGTTAPPATVTATPASPSS